MNLLAIETSSPTLSVAIKKSGAKLRHATVQGYMKHAENLLPVIDRLLKKEKLKIGDIDVFLISRGPGSFTGLRIGFATLKGFLAIRPKPCYGASSLDVIAAGISPKHTPGVCLGRSHPGCEKDQKQNLTLKGYKTLSVCLDARRGKLYARSYFFHEKKWRPRGPSRVLPIDELSAKLPRGSWIAGDGVTKLVRKDLAVVPEKNWLPRAAFDLRILEGEPRRGRAATLITLFETKDPLLKKLTRPKEFLPVYLRSSEAEERHREKNNNKHVCHSRMFLPRSGPLGSGIQTVDPRFREDDKKIKNDRTH